ncbi:hypothetical protein T492DRAFT_871358 [Pavlovales sp. CCMP2436]|nr:hypothetical protein T492DRAFT_871358 [Pavlovales sp. CCMP2436]
MAARGSSSLRDDGEFAQFFAEPFDATLLSSTLIEADADASYLARLNGGIARLERDAGAEVSANTNELVEHIESVLELESKLAVARERAELVARSAHRVQASLTAPCDRLRGHAAELRRLYDACSLLRDLHRLLYLSRRLRELLEPEPTDMAMAAEYVHEARVILANSDLSGIDAADAELPRLQRAEANGLRRRATVTTDYA